MGGNADYITFDFSAYTNPVVSVAFDVTIPNWAEGKNTVAYHWNNDANTLYPVSSAETETVRLQAPASARSFTIQRSAGTSTRIAGVCFQLAESSALNPHSAVATHRKMLRDGQLLIVGGENVYTISGQQIQ
jgi:hypothetical protein